MTTFERYLTVWVGLTAPASVSRAVAPVGAAFLWSASGSYDYVLLALIAGTLLLALGFWSAALLSRLSVQAA